MPGVWIAPQRLGRDAEAVLGRIGKDDETRETRDSSNSRNFLGFESRAGQWNFRVSALIVPWQLGNLLLDFLEERNLFKTLIFFVADVTDAD